MPVNFTSLCRDSTNFIKNQWVVIVILLLTLAIISAGLNSLAEPYMTNLFQLLESNLGPNAIVSESVINGMSDAQKQQLASGILSNLFKVLALSLISLLLFLSLSLALISLTAGGKKTNFANLLQTALSTLPALALFIILVFLCLAIIGSFLVGTVGLTVTAAIGLMIMNGFILTPIIVTIEKINVLSALRISFRLAYKRIAIVMPTLVLWVGFKIFIVTLYVSLPVWMNKLFIVNLATSVVSNLFSLFLLIYLYRFYSLIRHQGNQA